MLLTNTTNNDNSFTQLSRNINSTSKSLVINKDYKYSGNDNKDMGIIINKNNYVIDGMGPYHEMQMVKPGYLTYMEQMLF